MSSTRSTRRSRSGRQVRTTTCGRRAVARQSIERTSSPLDVLAQRVELGALAADPDRRASVQLAQPGQPRRQVLAARRTAAARASRPATPGDRCRPAEPERAEQRTVTRSASRSPRRVGSSSVVSRRRSPPGSRAGAALPVAPADGCHASRSQPRNPAAGACWSRAATSTPARRAGPGRPVRAGCRAGAGSRRRGCRARVTTTQIPTHSSTISRVGWMTTATTPSRSRSGNRPLTATATPPVG